MKSVLATATSSVSGEIFGHNQPRSWCFQVQPVTLSWSFGRYVVLYWFEVHSLDSSKLIGNFPDMMSWTSTGYCSHSTASSLTSGWFSPFDEKQSSTVVILYRVLVNQSGVEQMNGQNRPLFTDEPVEVEKELVQVQDVRKSFPLISGGIYRIYLKSIKKSRKMSTCIRLGSETLGSWPIVPKNPPWTLVWRSTSDSDSNFLAVYDSTQVSRFQRCLKLSPSRWSTWTRWIATETLRNRGVG